MLNTEFCKLSNDIYAAMTRKILVKHAERIYYILKKIEKYKFQTIAIYLFPKLYLKSEYT